MRLIVRSSNPMRRSTPILPIDPGEQAILDELRRRRTAGEHPYHPPAAASGASVPAAPSQARAVEARTGKELTR